MADHNDPNAVNLIFSDVDVSAADLYDIFGFPSDDIWGGEKVAIALTFAAAAGWGEQCPHRAENAPNPLKNDKEFLPDFPYLAEPW